MFKIKVPATSANIGPGFDCLGLSFNLANTYYVEKSNTMLIETPKKEWTTKNNLFNKAFLQTMRVLKKKGSFHLYCKPTIPLSGGLGSSASVIVAGCKAANILYGGKNKLSDDKIFEIATKIEGHPDNVAPAIFGGLVASTTLDNGKLYHKKYKVSKNLYFTILYPDFSVSTHIARKMLPATYKKGEVVKNISHGILIVEALQNGDFELLQTVHKDFIHEPYRKKLIKDYDLIKKEIEKNKDAVLLISGSGAALLCISKNKNFHNNINLKGTKANWHIKNVTIKN